MSACTDQCYADYEDCIQKCRRNPVPPPFKFFMPKKVYLASVCYPNCMAKYTACLAACAAEATAKLVVDVAAQAAEYVRNHPELVVGTVVIIAGVALIATTGPAGAIVLVAL